MTSSLDFLVQVHVNAPQPNQGEPQEGQNQPTHAAILKHQFVAKRHSESDKQIQVRLVDCANFTVSHS